MRRLHNDDWGFPTSCFVCEERNDAGLQIPFLHDEARDVVVADLELDGRFSGAPSYLHGGICLAVLDEAQAWATIAVGHRFAVTATTAARFVHPVRVGRRYRVEASITSIDETEIETSGTIADAKGRPCVTSTATFSVLCEAQALEAAGVEDLGEHRDHVRGS